MRLICHTWTDDQVSKKRKEIEYMAISQNCYLWFFSPKVRENLLYILQRFLANNCSGLPLLTSKFLSGLTVFRIYVVIWSFNLDLLETILCWQLCWNWSQRQATVGAIWIFSESQLVTGIHFLRMERKQSVESWHGLFFSSFEETTEKLSSRAPREAGDNHEQALWEAKTMSLLLK